VQSIIQSKITTQTIGGTSAGLAILGNWVYTADKCSAVSEDVLLNPFNRCTQFFKSMFLDIPFMKTILTDTHFGNIRYILY
jgi:cyanophycinase-like exopeptidase